MGVDPMAQGLALLGSLVLGGLLGCVYDGLRLLRRRRGALVAGALDLLFWALAMLGFLAYCLRFSGGELRWDLLCGTATGTGLYFLTISPLVLWIYRLLVRIFRKIFHIFLIPLTLSRAILKKIQKNTKKYFISSRKWYKMNNGILEMKSYYRKRFPELTAEGRSHVEAQAGIHAHKNRHFGGILLSRHHDAQSAKRHRRIQRHAKHVTTSGEHSSDRQRGSASRHRQQ